MGVDVNGARVVVCYAYPPGSRLKQSVWTALRDRFGIPKTGAPVEVVEQLRKEAKQTGLFAASGQDLGQDLWCLIDRAFTDAEVDALVAWCESVEQAIREHAVPGGLPPG